MMKKLMSINTVRPGDQLPTEIPDVSAPSTKSKQTRKTKSKWFSALCCAGVEEAVRQDLNMPPCGRGSGVTSTSGTDSAVLTVDRTSQQEPLSTFFGFRKDRIFNRIHREVTWSIKKMLPPKIIYYLSRKATFSLMSAILNDSLKQMNLSLVELYSHAEGLFLTGSSTEDVAQNLLLAALTKMQDFVQLCTLSDWLSGTRGSPINNHEELEEMLPSVTTAAVGVIVENMLSVCSEGTSCDFNEYGSDRPLWYFLQTVCDNINSATPRQPTHGAYCSMANEQLSIVQQANSSTKQCHTVGVAPYDPTKLLRIVPTYLSYEGSSDERLTQLCSEYEEIDAVETPSQVSLQFSQSRWSAKSGVAVQEYVKPRPRCERVLEAIIFDCTNEDHIQGPDTNEINTQALFSMSCEAFQLEASKRISDIIMSETSEITKVSDTIKAQGSNFKNSYMSTSQVSEAKLKSSAFASAASVVSELTYVLRRTFEEDLDMKLAHPFTDPELYRSQVQLVSEKILRSTQDKLREAFLTNLLMRAEANMSAQYGASLRYKLLASAKNITKNIIECLVSVLPCSEVHSSRGIITKEILQSLNENLDILYLGQLLTPSATHLEALSDLIIVDVFERIAEKVENSAALKESESFLKAMDRILSKDSVKQSSQELIPMMGNLMLERIAALDSVKAQTSCRVAQPVISADIADISCYQSTQKYASSALNSSEEIDERTSRWRFRLPKFLKLGFKKLKNKVGVFRRGPDAG